MRHSKIYSGGGGGGAVPGGPNRSYQFNNAGAFAGDSNAIQLVTGESQYTPTDDTHAALLVVAHSATQSATIADFSNNSTNAPVATFSFRGVGLGSFGTIPALVQLDVPTSNPWNLVLTNRFNINANFTGLVVGSSGQFTIQSNVGANSATIVRNTAGRWIITPVTGQVVQIIGTLSMGANAISGVTTLSMNGTLTATGNVNFGSSGISVLGFYGSAGTAQPTITGAKLPADVVLANLLTALAAQGLLVDAST